MMFLCAHATLLLGLNKEGAGLPKLFTAQLIVQAAATALEKSGGGVGTPRRCLRASAADESEVRISSPTLLPPPSPYIHFVSRRRVRSEIRTALLFRWLGSLHHTHTQIFLMIPFSVYSVLVRLRSVNKTSP